VLEVVPDGWGMMIAHPPGTHTAVSGARWFAAKQADGRQQQAVAFIKALWSAPIPRIAIEQPVSIMPRHLGKPTQIIHPWQFGHAETKTTCLWLKGLKPLRPTAVVEGREARVHREPPSPERWKNRSRTYPGIAEAMADQWGRRILEMEQSRVADVP
jgi:hypothetical protein